MSAILSPRQQAATRSASLVLHLFDLGHALLVEQMARCGIAAPPVRFMAGDEAADDQVDTEAEDAEDDEPICHLCNGSGEGMYGGSTCGACRGSGILRDRADEEDRLAAEADHAYDVWKDERAERANGAST